MDMHDVARSAQKAVARQTPRGIRQRVLIASPQHILSAKTNMMRIALLVAAVCVVQARIIAFGIQVRSVLPESC